MKTIFTILTTVALLAVFSLNAQVAINTDGSSPHSSAMLDIQSTTKGFSLPNLNISDMSTAAPVTSPKTGLVAYNTNTSTGPGIVMWAETKWVTLELEGINWKLLGNASTDASTNFVGTTDNVSLPFRTNNTERMRIEDDGQVVIRNGYSAPDAEDKLSVTGNLTNYIAIDAFSGVSGGIGVYGADGGNGYGLYGYANGTRYGIYGWQDGAGHAIRGYNASTGTGVSGKATNASAFGMWASNGNSSGTALIAVGNNLSGSYLTNGTGVAGTGNSGVYGAGKSSTGTGVIGVGNFDDSNDTIFTLVGGSGGAFTGASGVYAKVDNNSTGTGVIGVGNNISTAAVTTNGSGGAFTGQDGILGTAISSTGTGVIGVGNNNNSGSGYYTLSGIGSGGSFSGVYCGVYGQTSGSSGDRYGGYFRRNSNAYAYVGARISGINYKILGVGNVSTIVKDINEQDVIMFCPEAPESFFQDYGIGQLVNGKTHITLDPTFSKNIRVDENHPMKVFVTLEGDCKGIYVTNKTIEGFDVIELQGGTSNVHFSWQIVATRANEELFLDDGSIEVSDNSKRFPVAPPPPDVKEFKSRGVQQKALQQKIIKETNAKEEPKPKEVKKQDSKK
jgi:hypothetical protein